jgi:hypothetical protein
MNVKLILRIIYILMIVFKEIILHLDLGHIFRIENPFNDYRCDLLSYYQHS